jgi:hypothetical protein
MPTALSRLGACGGTLEGDTRVGVGPCIGCACGPRLLAPASPCGSGWALGDRPLTRLACVSRPRLSCGPDGQPPNDRGHKRGHPAEHPNFGFGRSAHNTQPTTGTKLISTLQATPNVVRRISDLSTSAHAIWDTPHRNSITRRTLFQATCGCAMSASTPPLPIPARHTTALQTVTSVYLRAPALLDVDDVYRARRPEAGGRRSRQ